MDQHSSSTAEINQVSWDRHPFPIGLWALGLLGGCIVLLPLVSILVLAFLPSENIWPHLLRSSLPRYLTNTVILMFGVGISTAFIGAVCAWLTLRYDFWCKRFLSWALLLPLALPGYLSAYAMVDFLEYSGPVQVLLRDMMGYETAREYWFPQIRSMGGAILILSLSLYPYVYLLARTAMKEQSTSLEDAARSLGTSGLARLWRISLPLARPAIAVGAAIAMMEAASDYGTVAFFSVQTMTTGIFTTWLQTHNASGAAQLAFVVLLLIGLLLLVERNGRRKMKFFSTGRNTKTISPRTLTPLASCAAVLSCALPVLLGFLLPVIILAHHSLGSASLWSDGALWRAFAHTVFIAFSVACVTCFVGFLLVAGVRHLRARAARHLTPLLGIGYAAPGAVLGLGVLIPLAHIDHGLADTIEAFSGFDPGLLLTGSSFAIIYALCVRFFAIPAGSFDAGFSRISPSLTAAARSMGRNRWSVLRDVELPLMRGAVGAAFLLVFVDSVKELPATLLLRPFNYETLATRAHSYASLEDIANAAPPALFIAATGMIAVLILARRLR